MPSNTLQPIQQDPQYVSESLVRGMDFTARLAPTADTLTGTPTVSVSVYSGSDSSPQSILVGSPSLSSNDMQILQQISGGVAGVGYLLTFKCGTTQGNTLVAEGIIYMVGG